MAEKKISFGFKQVKKQPLLLPVQIEEKKNDFELIQCLEGQEIKLVHEKEEAKPLVIPLLNSQKTSSALASLRNLKTVLNDEEQNGEVNDTSKSRPKTETMTIEQRVVTELLNEARNIDNDDNSNENKLTLPLAADNLPLDGAKQSSMDDYEAIPIAQFGLAMLRGMGLKDEEIKAMKNKEPELRPKGMGLGADKIMKKPKILIPPAENETLAIVKNAYIRILGGKHKDLYGQIQGLDDQTCRVIVKLALGGAIETLNEFMVQAVSKKEYQEYAKVINSAKYDEYKRKENEKDGDSKPTTTQPQSDRILKKEKDEIESSSRIKYDDEYSNRERKRDRSRERGRDRSTEKDRDRNRGKDRSRERKSDRDRDRSRERGRDRSRDRHRRSSSYDRKKSRDSDRNSYKSRRDRRSRSTDKYSHSSRSKY